MAQSITSPDFQALSVVPKILPEAPQDVSPEVRPKSPKMPEFSNLDAAAPLMPKSSGELAAEYQVTDKTIQSWFKIVRKAYVWLNATELQVGTSNQIRYTPLFQELLMEFRSSGLGKDQWIAHVHASHPDKLQPQPVELKFSPQPVAPSQPSIGSRLNLPTIPLATSSIVPTAQSLPTDTQEAKTLASTGKQAIEQNSQDLEQIRTLLQQVNDFVESKIVQLDTETEQTQQQVKELQDLAFQLEVKAEALRRAEIRNAAARQESENAKAAATNKVVSLSDFFAAKSQSPQAGS